MCLDDGRGEDDLLNLVVEIKGYRGEDAKEKRSAMETYWIPGVNNLKTYGRWGFAEFRDVYEIEAEFHAAVERALSKRESARRLARLGGSEPQLEPVPRRRNF